MPKPKEKTNSIYLPVYDYTVEIVITRDVVESRVGRNNMFGLYINDDKTTMAMHSYNTHDHLSVMFFTKESTIGCITHECSHCVDRIFDFIGAESVDTEIRAYHLDYLVGKVCKMLNKK